MLLQTNSYIVPAERRLEHQRLIKRFRQAMAKLGCDVFDVYEQVGPNWAGTETSGRFVQIMIFRDHQHQRQVQAAERSDPTAQALIAEFCELINLPYQQQQGLFAVGFYRSILGVTGVGQQHEAVQQEPDQEQPVEQAIVEEPVDVDQGAIPAEEAPSDTSYGISSEPPAEPQEESPQEFVIDHESEQQPHADGSEPIDEIDIEALAEEEVGGFQESNDPEHHRKG